MSGFARFHGIRRVVFECLLAAVLLVLILPAPAVYALTDDQARDASPADPRGRTVGIYIIFAVFNVILIASAAVSG